MSDPFIHPETGQASGNGPARRSDWAQAPLQRPGLRADQFAKIRGQQAIGAVDGRFRTGVINLALRHVPEQLDGLPADPPAIGGAGVGNGSASAGAEGQGGVIRQRSTSLDVAVQRRPVPRFLQQQPLELQQDPADRRRVGEIAQGLRQPFVDRRVGIELREHVLDEIGQIPPDPIRAQVRAQDREAVLEMPLREDRQIAPGLRIAMSRPRVSTSRPPEKLPFSRLAPLASPRTMPWSRVSTLTVWDVSEKSHRRMQMASSWIVGMGNGDGPPAEA